MKLAITVSIICLTAMSFIILFGFLQGNFQEEGQSILSQPWGIVSMVDLYSGFILFSMWIIYREKKFTKYLPWVIGMMLLGFFTGSLYTLINLIKSKGNWDIFWKGGSLNL